MDEYIKQMQDYLNKNKSLVKKEENENEFLKEIENNINNEKEELNAEDEDLDFQQIINSNKNNITNNNTNQIQNENINEEKEIKENKNIDDIPVTGNNQLNFNELLEKELSKEQNEGYNDINNNKVEPKFKYVPKKRKDIVSIPTNTKKYKYYSDNFKQKKRGNSSKKTKEIQNDEDEFIDKKEKKEKKERVAPIMPDNFKNSIFNRGKGYTGPKKEIIQENDNNIKEDENVLKVMKILIIMKKRIKMRMNKMNKKKKKMKWI